jgi:uncharacterized Zn finger protein
MARYGRGYGYGGWAPYVPVAERRRRAQRKMETLRKKGVDVQPIEIEGRKIAHTFWGESWCEHLESFSDFENRLPRGRTYVRNGSVCHLALAKGQVEAKVSGSELYTVKVTIKPLAKKKWNAIKGRCSGQIGSLLELLQGRLSDQVMGVVTDRKEGLFPLPGEMAFQCSCPDWAVMCKHVAAVLYGVGARLDLKPELLFQLRGVNHEELIEADAERAVAAATSRGKSKRLDDDQIGDVFGIELDAEPLADATDAADATLAQPAQARSPRKRTTKSRARKGAKTPRKTSAAKIAKPAASKTGSKTASKTGKQTVTKAGKPTAAARAKSKPPTRKKATSKKKAKPK